MSAPVEIIDGALKRRSNIRLSLGDMKAILHRGQGAICGLKRKGRLGRYSYGAYNDYWSDDVMSYLQSEIRQCEQRIKELKAGQVLLIDLINEAND